MVQQSKTHPLTEIVQLPNPVIDDKWSVGAKGIENIDDIIPYIQTHKVDALMHRNEHGVMWCTEKWKRVTNWCLEQNIPVLSFDFGYFDHYNHFMVDYYQPNCVSSIYKDWDNSSIPSTAQWDSALPSVRQYRAKFLTSLVRAKNDPPIKFLKGHPYVVIWTQWTTDLIRHCFYENGSPISQFKWLNMLIERVKQAGLVPVIKLSPVVPTKQFLEMQHSAVCILGRRKHMVELPAGKFINNPNARLIANAERHIICCSSVSNELVLAQAKVTAMGRSWFDNLGIFHEPKTWDDVLNYTPPNSENVSKWINWQMDHQCLKDNAVDKITETIKRATSK